MVRASAARARQLTTAPGFLWGKPPRPFVCGGDVAVGFFLGGIALGFLGALSPNPLVRAGDVAVGFSFLGALPGVLFWGVAPKPPLFAAKTSCF